MENKKTGFLMKTFRTLFCLGLILGSMLLIGCGENKKEITIGIIGSYDHIMEGEAEILWGIDMAIEDLNHAYEKYGYVVQKKFFDDGGMQEGAAEQAVKAIEDEEVDIIFFMCSESNIRNAADVLSKGDKLTFWLDESGQYHRVFDEKNQFHGTYRVTQQSETIMTYLKEMEVQDIMFVYTRGTTSEYTYNSLLRAAKKYDISMAKEMNCERLRAIEIANAVADAQVDSVAVVTGDGFNNAEIIMAIKEVAPDIEIVTDHSSDTERVLEKYKNSMDGVILVGNVELDWDPTLVSSLSNRYVGVYNGKRQMSKIIQGYFPTVAVVDAVIDCNTTDAYVLNDYFKNDGSDIYKFDKMGDIIIDKIPLFKGENGGFEMLKYYEVENILENEEEEIIDEEILEDESSEDDDEGSLEDLNDMDVLDGLEDIYGEGVMKKKDKGMTP